MSFQVTSRLFRLYNKKLPPRGEGFQLLRKTMEEATVRIDEIFAVVVVAPQSPAFTCVDVQSPRLVIDGPRVGEGSEENYSLIQIASVRMSVANPACILVKNLQPVYALVYQRAWQIACVFVGKCVARNET